jgi:hypothetical protein
MIDSMNWWAFLNDCYVAQPSRLSYIWIDTLSSIQVTSGKYFKTQNYMVMTPSWAVYGEEEGGFDPEQSPFKKERRQGAAALKN